ncbi:uncharacterized protein [Leptinotarsa decemlineata]|uniref:uncharacterized protein n=1 Tax=Leptinotarsa decemlineata TaxID=7539 RepID=UPI003D307209
MELVLNKLQQKYWVIHGQAAVRTTFSRSPRYRIERSKPLPPMMRQIPEERLKMKIRSFVNIGVDYFEPILVKIGKRRGKRWEVLFHYLEITHSLNIDPTIQAELRMAARRGQPHVIFCDHGTNLRGAANIHQAIEEMDPSSLIDSMSGRGITFKFIPYSPPHMEGAWEKLIETVKRTIGKVLHDQSLREETLQTFTFFAKTEKIVNSRP